MPPLLRMSDVSFAYSNSPEATNVIDHFALDIDEGEFVSIVGPSGSGKSTVLTILAGIAQPQSGRVLFQGNDISLFPAKRRAEYLNRDLAIISQFFNLVLDLSAEENVALPGIIGGMPARLAKRKAEKLLREVGLSEKTKAKVSRLSGGQRQRVAIARALINEPKAILADEPTGNLDRRATEAVMNLLRREQKLRKIALVVVTHDPYVASLSDRSVEIQ